jgi:hypothetical protein
MQEKVRRREEEESTEKSGESSRFLHQANLRPLLDAFPSNLLGCQWMDRFTCIFG